MATRKTSSLARWFDNCGGWSPEHNLRDLQKQIENGLLNEQDEYGMTGLSLAVMSGWKEGVDALLEAKADTELRYYRTGETALHMAVQERNEPIIAALIDAGANPDAANYWGVTPRKSAGLDGLAKLFRGIARGDKRLPVPLIQNAEHLADHYHPRFKIPKREERETLRSGQAVDLYVYGPKSRSKQDTVKVRITARTGRRPNVRFKATVETPMERTHLVKGMNEVEFGPEHVATIYVPRPDKKNR